MRVKNVLIITLSLILLTSCTINITFGGSDNNQLGEVKAEFHFLNVGQGDSTLIKLDNYIILVDAGPDNAEEAIVNYLMSQDIQKIDLLIATHPHDDHIGAIDYVLENFDVVTIIDSGLFHPNYHYEDYEAAISKEVLLGAEYLEDEDLTIDINVESFIEIIENGDEWEGVNNHSVVCKVTCGEISLLLTGDLEQEGEKALLNLGADFSADIFAVGHHGSSTSNTKEFVEQVNPSYAVISAGLDNQYGLPHQEVNKLFSELQVQVYETAYYGNVVLKTDGKTIIRDSHKEVNQIDIIELDDINEIVTIKNMSKSDIDLTNWYLLSYKGNQRYDFPDGYILKAGAIVNITSGKNAFDDGIKNLKWTTKNVWSNSENDPAYLYDDKGKMVVMKS